MTAFEEFHEERGKLLCLLKLGFNRNEIQEQYEILYWKMKDFQNICPKKEDHDKTAFSINGRALYNIRCEECGFWGNGV